MIASAWNGRKSSPVNSLAFQAAGEPSVTSPVGTSQFDCVRARLDRDDCHGNELLSLPNCEVGAGFVGEPGAKTPCDS